MKYKEERRRYLRVSCNIPARYVIIPPSKVSHTIEKLKKDYETKYNKWRYLDEIMNKGLSNEFLIIPLLVNIDQKLDTILKMLEHGEAKEFEDIEPPLQLSGAGLLFRTRKKISPGDFLYIELEIPLTFPFKAEIMGKVQRINPVSSDSTEVAVEFLELPEFIKEKIIRYTLQRERELIRKRKEE